MTSSAILALDGISFVRNGLSILDDVSLVVEPDQRWLVLGANGSGKTSLLRIAAMYEHPTSGSVTVLGETLGSTDVRVLRQRIGYLSASITASLRPRLTAVEAVMTAKFAALEPWWHTYSDDDIVRAHGCLGRMGVEGLAERDIGSLSSGELQRVLLARTLMTDPGIILLDEPSARLDLGGRENLVTALTQWATNPSWPPIVLVTHHLDEVPAGITHCLMLKAGRTIASGSISDCLTSELVSLCFDVDLTVERRHDGRWSAYSRH